MKKKLERYLNERLVLFCVDGCDYELCDENGKTVIDSAKLSENNSISELQHMFERNEVFTVEEHYGDAVVVTNESGNIIYSTDCKYYGGE